MTNRRQALCSREPLATCIFLSLILVFIFALPSILVRAEPSSSSANAAVDQGVTNSVANIGPHVLPLTVVPKPELYPAGLTQGPRGQPAVLHSRARARVT